MKHFTHLVKTCLTVLVLAAINLVSAQTTVSINNVNNSAYNACPTPISVTFQFQGSTTGYISGVDDIDMKVSYGDGFTQNITLPLTGTTTQFFTGTCSHTFSIPGTYVVQFIATGTDGNADTTLYGNIIVASGCTTLEGDVYFDNNTNCVFDAGDDPWTNVPIIVRDPGSGTTAADISFTNGAGHYIMSVPTGYNLKAEVLSYFVSNGAVDVTCPALGYHQFTSTGAPVTFDFGVECNNTTFDLQAEMFGSVFAPGITTTIIPWVQNASCVPVSGTITVTLDPKVQYMAPLPGYPIPTSVVGNTITWNFSNIAIQSNNWATYNTSFPVMVKVDTTVVAGDSMCFTISVTPTAGDANPADNASTECYTAVASYDPNDKRVFPAGVGATGDILPNTELTYLVNFQNTGTYPATNVYIIDTLDQHLDLSTFEVLGTSHSMVPTIYNVNRVKFNFANINLIDSTANEPLSHGWVLYKIKTKPNLTNGTQITNTAHIFFDYNPAVVTNTTLNTINTSLSIAEVDMLKNRVYPNPVSNTLIISFEESISGVLQVHDVTGRLMETITLNGKTQTQLDVSRWDAGMYQITFNGGQLANTRFIVAR